MAETVIYPLSEETGLRILAVLTRIAEALEGESGTIEDDMLVLNNATIDDGYLVTNGVISEGYLEI